jgi:hypothetical protein
MSRESDQKTKILSLILVSAHGLQRALGFAPDAGVFSSYIKHPGHHHADRQPADGSTQDGPSTAPARCRRDSDAPSVMM